MRVNVSLQLTNIKVSLDSESSADVELVGGTSRAHRSQPSRRRAQPSQTSERPPLLELIEQQERHERKRLYERLISILKARV